MIYFDTIDSTITWAVAHFNELADCEFIAAAVQTAGRGRLDRKWISPRGNLYTSFILKDVSSGLLGIAAGSLAVLDLVRTLAPSQKFHIKWPNDIFCRRRRQRRWQGRSALFRDLGIAENTCGYCLSEQNP